MKLITTAKANEENKEIMNNDLIINYGLKPGKSYDTENRDDDKMNVDDDEEIEDQMEVDHEEKEENKNKKLQWSFNY
ncbi:hypothetical protein KGF54_000490 [Candida jiufengensis]|uniref:uncharacterized protein n=1 Tax=Candida jiufengensis TaxID=497108 RepID=UPI0022252EBB|nr:uncharacterized protein KGF54_000490 [Candida jiufengensis]KAI5956872.1 hypothetical protein KGF54_000490 [Candida jiufengensis]